MLVYCNQTTSVLESFQNITPPTSKTTDHGSRMTIYTNYIFESFSIGISCLEFASFIRICKFHFMLYENTLLGQSKSCSSKILIFKMSFSLFSVILI